MNVLLLIATLSLSGDPPPTAGDSPEHAHPLSPVVLAPDDPAAAGTMTGRMATDGDWAVVAAPSAGAVHVFRFQAGEWSEDGRLGIPRGETGYGFGADVAISGGRVAVGAPGEPMGGAVYVFQRVGETWRLAQKLQPADGQGGDFGAEVELEGDDLVVGAPLGESPFTVPNVGAIYTFEHEHRGGWKERDKFVPPGGGYGGDGFGSALDLDGGVLVVGAPLEKVGVFDWGRAYVLERFDTGWAIVQTLDATASGAAFLEMGAAVAVDGDTLAVAAPGDGPGTNFQGHGAVYLYGRAGTGWELETKIARAALPYTTSDFAVDVALEGDRLVVTADGGPDHSVHVYERTRIGWVSTEVWESTGGAILRSVKRTTESYAWLAVEEAGEVRIEARPFAHRPDLTSAPTHVALNEPGARHDLAYDAGGEWAGTPYVVVGTLSGTGPTVVDGVSIPIAFDAYTTQTIMDPRSTHLVGSVGVLDAQGRAAASFVVPPGGLDISFGTMTFHHAFVLLDPAGATAVHASDAAQMSPVF